MNNYAGDNTAIAPGGAIAIVEKISASSGPITGPFLFQHIAYDIVQNTVILVIGQLGGRINTTTAQQGL